MKDVLELPKKGKAMVITELHGNVNDLINYVDLFNNSDCNHLIIAGDSIHADNIQEDMSVDMMNMLMMWEHDIPEFHVLLGNHELSVINNHPIYKGENQLLQFNNLIIARYGYDANDEIDKYKKFLNGLPLAARTQNGVFISHAGPFHCTDPNERIDVMKHRNDLMWNRPEEDYNVEELDNFLKAVHCNAMIVGHSTVDGAAVYGNQLIVASGMTTGSKALVELDLETDVKSCDDLAPMVRFIQGVPRH